MIKAAHHRPYALVVDDDQLIRMGAAEIIEDAGFIPLEAGTGDEGIVLLQAHHDLVQLLFTDVQMPGLRDGFALARETALQWPHIAIVIASGELRPGFEDLPVGAVFIDKPFSGEVVHRHLRRMLSA